MTMRVLQALLRAGITNFRPYVRPTDNTKPRFSYFIYDPDTGDCCLTTNRHHAKFHLPNVMVDTWGRKPEGMLLLSEAEHRLMEALLEQRMAHTEDGDYDE